MKNKPGNPGRRRPGVGANSYSKEQTDFIASNWDNMSVREKNVYAVANNKSISSLNSKNYYEKNYISKKKKLKVNSKDEVIEQVVVKTLLKNATLLNEVVAFIGDTKVIIPSRSFEIDGVKISC